MTKKNRQRGHAGRARGKHRGVGQTVDKVRKTGRERESEGRMERKRDVIKKP